MAKKRLTHQQKVVIIVTVVTLVAVFGVMFGLFFYFLFNTSPTVRRKMLAYYSDDSSYIEVCVTLKADGRQIAPQEKDGQFSIGVEYDDPDEKKLFDVGGGFAFPSTVYDVLIANGIDFGDDVKCRITAAPRIWWDGGVPFAVAIKSADGQTTYLDYETGKANLLYYIEHDMD